MDKKIFLELLNNLKAKVDKIFLEYNFKKIYSFPQKDCSMTIQPYKNDLLATTYKKILDAKGIEEFEKYRQIILLKCLIYNWDDVFSDKYPLSIQNEYRASFKRFLDMCNSEGGWGFYDDDVYWKDLAIARQQIYPAGAGIVESYSGFGLRQGLSFNFVQSLKFIKLMFHLNGRRGYYEIHTHTPLLNNFNEQGWSDSYIRIAEMLMKHEEIKGVFRCSWFIDPQLKSISPRLFYLQNTPLSNGAISFYVGKESHKKCIQIKDKTSFISRG